MTLSSCTGIGTILFDYDGTLHNSAINYYEAFLKTYGWLVELGYAPPRAYSLPEVTRFLGHSPQGMWQRCLPDLPPDIRDQAIARLGAVLLQRAASGLAVLYDGALETVAQLRRRGYRTLFLSHCPESYLIAHRDAFHLEQYFDGMYCTGAYGFRSKREILPELLQGYPGTYLVVGDRSHDIELGQLPFVQTVGCRYGFGTPEELADADVQIDDIRALLALPNPV